MTGHDYDEKRGHRRMGIDCPMSFTVVESGEKVEATARDLSATGMLIVCTKPLPEGTLLQVNVTPRQTVVRPLNALVEVVRVEPLPPAAFQLGVVIREFND